MNLFLQYLKQQRKFLLMQIVFASILLLSFVLYQLPIEAIWYPLMLCALCGSVFFVVDFWKVRKSIRVLQHIEDFMDIVSGTFPQTNVLLEQEYQRLLTLLTEEHLVYQNKTNQSHTDMMEYYTLWIHQIKTPIASMRLHLQNEDSALLRKLKIDLVRIEQYVEMVLVYLRLESEDSDYVIQKYKLDTILRQTIKKFSSEFINRKLSLVYEPIEESIITDEKWFAFVIEQILSNALKYTVSGSITIKVQERKLYIQDTGIGIASEDIPRIFEKGFTGYNGRMDKKASGIGLYLCKRICKNLGYEIRVESVVGKGTTVLIDIAQKTLEIE